MSLLLSELSVARVQFFILNDSDSDKDNDNDIPNENKKE